ncbi:hypothetical protein [Nannocystis punicea]|uniref:DUF4259 domain-containing protein n=1 Tax=Nannocystis punicea TaxID=2995304 RepID=A0ABY7HB39_9BACT|nr:hypothetical protein [Nannocystis poenicansa]WAS96421.1 hypothetical protein O0S08_09705 [Nannocystis poenicansa]
MSDAMGTWGDGIYDNDSALDGLAALVARREGTTEAARLVAHIGLLAWLDPVGVTHDPPALWVRLDDHAAAIAQLPEDTRAALQRLRDDPEGVTEHGSRTPEVQAALGGYCDGPRMDALLRFPGAQPVIDELAGRAVAQLDRVLGRKVDLYEVAGDLVALGVLVELAKAGLWTPQPARVAAWRTGFAAIDKATRSERGFWWKYVRRVHTGFDLLAPPPPDAPAKRARPLVRKPAAPAPAEPERYTHPKFGAGTLIARTGSGDGATLELRFDDGVTRKILARFLAPERS